MLKRNKILLIVLAILISLVAFLSFGFQTSNFNDLIQKRFNDQYKKVKLEFKDIRVSLDIKDFAVKFSLNQPKLYHKGDLTNIYQTNFGVGIFSAIKGNYNPKFIEIKFSENSEIFLLFNWFEDNRISPLSAIKCSQEVKNGNSWFVSDVSISLLMYFKRVGSKS